MADANASKAIDEAASTYGFFQVSDHNVPNGVLDAMKAVTQRFFDQPLAEKLQWRSPSPDINRGYAAKGTEGLSYSIGDESPPDLFEAFNLGPDDVDQARPWADTLFFAENIWPTEQREFRSAVTEYFEHVRGLAHRLTTLFANALLLDEDFFAMYTDHSTDTLRINHYQSHASDPVPVKNQLGMGAHTDYGIVTVLYTDAVPGLEIVGPDGSWIAVQPEPDCFLVNLGDLTAEWTNDRWRSTVHRVLPPALGTSRRSAAFFHDGNYDSLISCLPTCTSSDNPARYPPVVAGDHLMTKLLGPRTLTYSNPTIDTTKGRGRTFTR